MYIRAIGNDLKRNPAIAITTLFFIAAASLLIAFAAILVVHLSGSIDSLMNSAKTPHFMQMHSGTLDTDRLEAFTLANKDIEAYTVSEFLNIPGEQIHFETTSLAGNVQDNGFSLQGKNFDFLLDLDGTVIQPEIGEVYVPIPYMKEGLVRKGETLEVMGKSFLVVGFLRDSQMNSLLYSSKRFLIHEKDFAWLRDKGSIEYLIEFRLKDLSRLQNFESAYTVSGLEANGPTITYPLFKLINGLSDGLMIGLLMLIAVLVIAVSFLCIRFTLLAKIEDDYREIGVMKAIGLRISDIKKIYLVTYAGIAAAGVLLGYMISLLFRDRVLDDIRLFMGDRGKGAMAGCIAILSILFVFVLIFLYVNSLLRRFKKISPVDAIRYGVSQDIKKSGRHFHLHTNRLFSTNIYLGLKDVLQRKKLYSTMLIVLLLAVFIMIVPQNLYNTISSKYFISYMGVGYSDIRIDLQQLDALEEKVAAVQVYLEEDAEVSRYAVYTTKTFQALLDNETEERLKIELGDHSIFPLAYSEGKAPVLQNEIALSVMLADELQKKTGGSLSLVIGGQTRSLVVSGLYSDVTNGGKTAKAVFTDDSAASMWSVINIQLADTALLASKVQEYETMFPYAKISDIEDYIKQTYGATIRSVSLAAFTATAIAIIISILITVLFMRMLVGKDRSSIAIAKAFGYTNRDIRIQYITRALSVFWVSTVSGTILANTLGERIAGASIATFGVASFSFVIQPFQAYIVSPLLLAVSVSLVTVLGTLDAGKIRISENIKE